MKRNSIFLALSSSAALWACEPGVQDKDYKGEPLITLNGRTMGNISAGMPADSVRAAFVWSNFTDGEECFERARTDSEILRCAFEVRPTPASEGVAIDSEFPTRFKLPLYDLPPPSSLAGEPGSFLGFGSVVVYNDGNGNKTLDMVPIEALSSADTPLGGLRAAEFVVYREGALAPVWKLFGLWGCEEPPQGFSVYDLDAPGEEICVWDEAGFEKCETPCERRDSETELLIQIEDSQEMREQNCELGQLIPIAPTSEPPAGSNPVCSEDGAELSFNPHPERYCTESNTITYSLVEQEIGGELVQAPDWWPCELLPDEYFESDPLFGLYEISSHTLASGLGCSEEQPITDGLSHLRLQREEADGVDLLAIYACDKAIGCSAQSGQLVDRLAWQGFAWLQESRSVQGDTKSCSLEYRANTAFQEVDGEFGFVRYLGSDTVALEAGETCDEDLVTALLEEIPCTSFELLEARRIDD